MSRVYVLIMIPIVLLSLSLATVTANGNGSGIIIDWVKNYGEDTVEGVYLSSSDDSLLMLFRNKLVKYTISSEGLREQWVLNKSFTNAVLGEMNLMNTPCFVVASEKNITLINKDTGAIVGTVKLDDYMQSSDRVAGVSGGDDLLGIVTSNGKAMAVWFNSPNLSVEGAYTVMTTNLTGITLVSVNTWDPEGEVLVTFANETSVFTYNVTSSQALNLKWSRTLNPTVSSVLWNPSGAGLVIIRADYRPYYFYLRAYYVDKNNHTLYYNPYCGYFSWQSRSFHNPIVSARWERDNNTVAYIVEEITNNYRYRLVRYNSTSGFYYNVTYHSDLKYYTLTLSGEYSARYGSVSTRTAVLARSTDAMIFEVKGTTVTKRMFQFSLPGLSVGYYLERTGKLYLATTPNSDYEVFIVDINPQTGSLGETIDKFKPPSSTRITNVYIDDLAVTSQGNPLLAYRDCYRSSYGGGDYYYYIHVKLFNKDPGNTRDREVNLINHHYQSYRITGSESIMGPVISPNEEFIAFTYASKPYYSYSPSTPLYYTLVIANLTELYTRDANPLFTLEYRFRLIDDYLMGPVAWSSNGSLLLMGLGNNITVLNTSSSSPGGWWVVKNIILPYAGSGARVAGLAVFSDEGREKLAVLLWHKHVGMNVEEGVNLYVINLDSLTLDNQSVINNVFYNNNGSVNPIIKATNSYIIVVDKVGGEIKYYDKKLNLVGTGSLNTLLQRAGENRISDVVFTDNGHTLYLVAGSSVVKARIPDPSTLQQTPSSSQHAASSQGGSHGSGGSQNTSNTSGGGSQSSNTTTNTTQASSTQQASSNVSGGGVKLTPEQMRVFEEVNEAVAEVDEALKPLADLGNMTTEDVVKALNEINATQLMEKCIEEKVIVKVLKLDDKTRESLRKTLEEIYGPGLVNYPTEMGRFYLLYTLYYQQQ